MHWKSLHTFLLAGPPAGLASLLILMFIHDPTEAKYLEGLASIPVILLVGLPFSYIFGLAPAAISGLLHGVLVANGWSGISHSGAASFFIGAVVGTIGCAIFLPILGPGDLFNYYFLIGIGAPAGGACAILVRRRENRANNSFKPNSPRESA
jgi:hypothetical protein